MAEARGLVEKPNLDAIDVEHAVIFYSPGLRTLDWAEKGAGNEIQLTDAMVNNGKHLSMSSFEGRRYDCGTKQGLSKPMWPLP